MAKRTGSKLLAQSLAKDAQQIAQAGQRITQSPTRLTKALAPKDFGKLIKHIPQHELLALSVSSLNRLLVNKGIVPMMELQQALLDEAEIKGF
jgi:hypothetical protein